MNDPAQVQKDSSPEQPTEDQTETRVLVPLERCVYEQIKNTLKKVSKNSYIKISVPQFLSRVIKSNWEHDMAVLKSVDKEVKNYMSGTNPDIDPDYG